MMGKRFSRLNSSALFFLSPALRSFLWLMVLFLVAGLFNPGKASARTRVIYPPDKTVVHTATIPIIGITDTPGRMVRITLNGGGIIPTMNDDGTFNQSVRLRPGRNILKIDGLRLYVSFLRKENTPPKGFNSRYIHPAIEDDCGDCHDFAVPGDYSVSEQGMDLCLNCHDNPTLGKDGVMSQVHSPIGDDGDCLACHDPHVGQTSSLTVMDLPDLCYECHDPVDEGKKNRHGPVAAGDCTACHGAHASTNRHLLVSPGQELCLDCHSDPILDTKSPGTGLKFVHEALEEGCSSCHDPHASNQRMNLVMGQLELCGQCHEDIVPEGDDVTGHSPIADDEDCVSCHNPHASRKSRLLNSTVADLCYECHDDVTQAAGENGVVHTPVEEGDCADCHNPHGGQSAILRAGPPALCYECHDPIEPVEGGSTHEPFEGGDCTDCHHHHASRYPSLLPERGKGLCYQCHDEFEGAVVHSPIADDDSCTECHNPHGGQTGKLLSSDGMDLCLQCHENPTILSGLRLNKSIHSPISEDRQCTPCHSPHAGEEYMLTEKVPELCYQCHDDVTLNKVGAKFENVHSPVADDACVDCHRPHSSDHEKLQVEQGNSLCLVCHDDPALDETGQMWAFSHPPVEEGCTTCHLPHGSDHQGNLVEETVDLCFGCHADHPGHSLDASGYLEVRSSGTVVLPDEVALNFEGTMVCTGCHNPHGATHKPLLDSPKMELCQKCHRM